MLSFIARKLIWACLTLIGVMIVTFLLFRVAAGDPAATLAGKNPQPEELEALRDSIGSDKPLFFGTKRKTELYSSADFTGAKSNFRNIDIQSATPSQNGMILGNDSKIVFTKNFDVPEGRITVVELKTDKPLVINNITYNPTNGFITLELLNAPNQLSIRAALETATIGNIRFFRKTDNPLDSQLVDSAKELVAFSTTFPFVSFFNFGHTLQTREEIKPKLGRGMIVSLSLMIPVFIGEIILGIVLAMISSATRGSIADRIIMLFSIATMSISYLALIIFGQWYFAYYLNYFPVWGYGSIQFLILPVAIGIVSGCGGGVRFYRSVFLNEMNKEYLRTATAKGLAPRTVYFKHLLSNAMIPIITRASSVLPFLFTGSLLLESFFGIPGLGYEGVNALNDADLQMLKAIVLLSAVMFVVINFMTDLICAWVDPRIRLDKDRA